MKNTLSHLSQGIAGFVAFVFFMRFFDNLDSVYLAGIAICIAIIFALRMTPSSGNSSISEILTERDKKVTSLSLASASFILACGAATPFLFGVRPTSSGIVIFFALAPIGLLFGAMLVAIYQSIKFPGDNA